MKRNSVLSGIVRAVMVLALVLPLVVAPEESDWLEPLTRQLVSFIGVGLTSLILGDIAETRLRLPLLGRICGPVSVGVIVGFLLAGVELYSGESQYLAAQAEPRSGIAGYKAKNLSIDRR